MTVGRRRHPGRPVDVRAVLAVVAHPDDESFGLGAVLKAGHTELLDYPDGLLDQVPLDDLAGQVRQFARTVAPSHPPASDICGITGHPDRLHATRAALRAVDDLGLLVPGWTIPQDMSEALNTEFGTGFTGRRDRQAGQRLVVDRARQYRAIRCHHSQATDNPVLYRRLELLGTTEHVRLSRPASGNPAGGKPSRKEATWRLRRPSVPKG